MKKAIFYDKNNNLCYFDIDYGFDTFIIKGYDDLTKEQTLISKFLIDDNKIYIDVILCYTKYRNRGIASALLDLVDYIFKNCGGFIYGAFGPCDSSIPDNEIYEQVRSFYTKNGYKIISKNEFIENISKYYELNEKDFEKTKEKFDYSIIFKRITKKSIYRFEEFIEEGILVESEDYKNRVDGFDFSNTTNGLITR